MKNYFDILTEKLQKYQYHPKKMINMNLFQANKYYLLIKVEFWSNLNLHILLLEKYLKKMGTITNQDEEQIISIQEHEKQLANSNAFIQKDILPPSEPREIFYNRFCR